MAEKLLQGDSLKKVIFDEYISNYCTNEKGMRASTLRGKKELLERLVIFLNDIPFTYQSILSFRNEMYKTWKTPNSRADVTRELRSLTNFLYKREYLHENFARKLEKPKIPRITFDYIAPETVQEVIEAGTASTPFVFGKAGDNSRNVFIKKETRLALLFILRTGLRINEMISLEGKDININDSPVSFWVNSKGGNRDLLPLPKDMIEIVKPRMSNDRLFQVTEKTCNKALKTGMEILGIKAKLTCHTLRHIFATNLSKQGVAIQLISRLMRHSSVQITMDYYTHLNVNDLSLIVNQQNIVREGSTPQEVLELLREAIKKTGIESDKRFHYAWEHCKNGRLSLNFKVEIASAG